MASLAAIICTPEVLVTAGITYVITTIIFNMGIEGHMKHMVDSERYRGNMRTTMVVTDIAAKKDECIAELERRIDDMNHNNLRVQELEEDLAGAHELIAELEEDKDICEQRLRTREEMLSVVSVTLLCFTIVSAMFSLLFIIKLNR